MGADVRAFQLGFRLNLLNSTHEVRRTSLGQSRPGSVPVGNLTATRGRNTVKILAVGLFVPFPTLMVRHLARVSVVRPWDVATPTGSIAPNTVFII